MNNKNLNKVLSFVFAILFSQAALSVSPITVQEAVLRSIETSDLKTLAALLQDKSFDKDQVLVKQDTALLVAVSLQKSEVVQFLIDKKVDLKKRNADGEDAVYLAAANHDLEILKMLEHAGADLSSKATNTQDTALHLAALNDDANMVKFLLKKVPSLVNQANKDLETPLHKTAIYGANHVIPLLLKAKANKAAKNSKGQTAYDLAHAASLKTAAKLLKISHDRP